jgi:hypothetical protein
MTELPKISGIRTNWLTKETKKVELRYYIMPYNSSYAKTHELVFYLVGGSTGYESFTFVPFDKVYDELAKMKKQGWFACFGTGHWDKLVIEAEEMQKVSIEEGVKAGVQVREKGL